MFFVFFSLIIKILHQSGRDNQLDFNLFTLTGSLQALKRDWPIGRLAVVKIQRRLLRPIKWLDECVLALCATVFTLFLSHSAPLSAVTSVAGRT